MDDYRLKKPTMREYYRLAYAWRLSTKHIEHVRTGNLSIPLVRFPTIGVMQDIRKHARDDTELILPEIVAMNRAPQSKSVGFLQR
jgi:hypothetical protein